jgi:hypothetical protein
MATGGSRISLPLAVGVDCGHPRPLGVDHGHPQWPDLFFLVGSPEANMATKGDRISPLWPLGWIAATPSGQIYLFFFFFLFAEKVARGGQRVEVDGGVHRRRWEVGYLFGCLIC